MRHVNDHGYSIPPTKWLKQFNERTGRWLEDRGERNVSFGDAIKQEAKVRRAQREAEGGAR